MTTLLLTFLLVVGLALVVLLTVAAPSMRRRGSRTMHRIDAGIGVALPVLQRRRDQARTALVAAVEARRRTDRDRETAHQH